jgi:hypothetical protein
MADGRRSRERYGEAFWRAHHEAWQRSNLNQREYCEAQGIPLKAFGNWRAKFKAEPQPPTRKLLYRRGGLSHTLSHSSSHTLSHVTYPSSLDGRVVPPARDGHRRRFSQADKRWTEFSEATRAPHVRLAPAERRTKAGCGKRSTLLKKSGREERKGSRGGNSLKGWMFGHSEMFGGL